MTIKIAFPIAVCLAAAAGAAIGQDDKPPEEIGTDVYGDVSGRSAEALPELDADYPGPSVAEYRRMLDFLERQVPTEGVVKSLETAWGDVIDCVDVKLQPALLRPGMENHRLQLEPRSSASLRAIEGTTLDAQSKLSEQDYARLPDTCSRGTVPIRRLTIDELTRFQTLDDFLARHPGRDGRGREIARPEDLPEAGPTDRHQYAVGRRYVQNWGAESVLNLWKPYTESSAEFSLSQIWVARGSGDDLETLEAGWQKYRQKYGDWRSRLFIYFTPDNYDGDGCYNLDCGTFVQTDNSVYIGGGFTDYSTHDGPQYTVKLLWYKDGESGNWWLRYGSTWVGYYPRDAFDSNGLRDRGSRVTFGGEIIDNRTDGRHTRTDMGSGYMPAYGWRWAAYQRSVRYVDTANFYRRASSLSTIVSDEDCYDIDLAESSGSWEVHFYFGGWGYNSQCE